MTLKTTRFGRPKSLRCKWCRGPHKTSDCLRPGTRAKLPIITGTSDPETGDYIPPPGVAVRYVVIPRTVHSDRIARLLKEMEE